MESISQRLEHHVRQLAGVIGERNLHRPEALDAARHYIEQTWRQQGYDVRTQEYPIDHIPCANLEVTHPGTTAPRQILLVGAHYDTLLGSPGANDNGSGVAALLELSRRFSERETGCSLRFVAFTNEEPPFFFTRRQGSRVYAQAARARGDDIRLMVALETMGYFSDRPGSQRYPPLLRHFYPDRGDFIALVSDFRSRREMLRLARAFRQVSDFPLEHLATSRLLPGVAWSDHLSFWREGYRALMVTDTAFYRYPYYHTAEDTAEKLDYGRLGRVTEGLCEALGLLARAGPE